VLEAINRATPSDRRPGSCGAIAPAMRQLYALLAAQGDPQADADEAAVEAEVARIMEAVERELLWGGKGQRQEMRVGLVGDNCCGHVGTGAQAQHSWGVCRGLAYLLPLQLPTRPPADVIRWPAAGRPAACHQRASAPGSRVVAACSIDSAGDASMADAASAAEGGSALDADECAGDASGAAAAVAASAATQRREQEEAEVGARLAEQYGAEADPRFGDDSFDGDLGGWDAGDDGSSDGGDMRPGPAARVSEAASMHEGEAYGLLVGC
jgi:hypothetical protein